MIGVWRKEHPKMAVNFYGNESDNRENIASPTSTPTSTPTSNTSILDELSDIDKRLVLIIEQEERSVKEMMDAIGLKDRKNFLEYSLTPAIAGGLVKMKYPDSPRHPRQKYLLTVKGLAIYNELKETS